MTTPISANTEGRFSSSPLPKVTVVMPAYNASATILESINSILGQTFPDLELLIGDDASTDATSLLLSTVTDPRIHISRNMENMGPGATRDSLIAKARGDWIAFCDADDSWHPERLAILMSASVNNENAVIFDDIMECHSTERGIVPWRRLRGPAVGEQGKPLHMNATKLIDSKRMFIKPFFSQALLRESGARHSDHAYGEDGFFLLKLLVCTEKLIYVPDTLYFYRITPGSASKNAQRYALLKDILESSVSDFESQPEMQAALRRKIRRVNKSALYAPFALAIKGKRIGNALRLLVQRPWLAVEFTTRGFSDLRYHLHRLYHGGATRGSK